MSKFYKLRYVWPAGQLSGSVWQVMHFFVKFWHFQKVHVSYFTVLNQAIILYHMKAVNIMQAVN